MKKYNIWGKLLPENSHFYFYDSGKYPQRPAYLMDSVDLIDFINGYAYKIVSWSGGLHYKRSKCL